MINKVILLGNVGGDPEIRSLPSGGRVANFSLATSEFWKAEDGTRKEKTEWHRIVVFQDAIVGVVEKYVKKGSKLYIEGSIRTRDYTDSSGSKKYTTEVVIRGIGDRLKLLDGKGSDGGADTSGTYSSGSSSSADSGSSGGLSHSTPSGDSPATDDDIPF